MLDILRRQLYSANEQKQQNKLLCNYIFFFLYKPINFDLTEVKHVGWMHFTRRHAVFFSFLFCDPPLIPFSLHLPNSTRGSEVRLGYRTTPLEVSEAPRLAQRHLYTTNLISLYASAQPLLAILVINLPHTRTEESIIDTWYDPHKCCHIKDNYSYQYEPDCPCIDVIFPSALIRPFCVQNAPRGQNTTRSLAWITKLFWGEWRCIHHSLCELKRTGRFAKSCRRPWGKICSANMYCSKMWLQQSISRSLNGSVDSAPRTVTQGSAESWADIIPKRQSFYSLLHFFLSIYPHRPYVEREKARFVF